MIAKQEVKFNKAISTSMALYPLILYTFPFADCVTLLTYKPGPTEPIFIFAYDYFGLALLL